MRNTYTIYLHVGNPDRMMPISRHGEKARKNIETPWF
jgi:hypothetical protein